MHSKLNRLVAVTVTASLYLASNAANVINVPACDGDATAALRDAIAQVADYKGKPVTIKLSPGNYNISREQASQHLYHISNTASAEENPDQTKHIGLWFRNLRNVTLDGNGAWIVTHGEMTPFVIDKCENITLTNFTLTAADPSVPEFKVVAADRNSMTVEITPPSQFDIIDGDFNWKGEGWHFAEGARETVYPEFAQVFYPDRNVTLRCDSPLKGRRYARKIADNIVQFFYDRTPDVHVGEIYQMRHGIRNEACGFFNLSRNITLENIEFNFLGNFGLVGQFSENLTYNNIRCRPRLGSGRTDAGFADFVQMSGCRGIVRITNSYFEGAHDDPINIHGTHLKVIESTAPDKVTVRFMHGQTYGFDAFFKGDDVEIVNRHTLNCILPAKVKATRAIDDYSMEITLDRNIPSGLNLDDCAVENVTWTPEVEIINNYFSRIPTRGILITTRRKALIENNTFYRLPMPAILVSDDARGWYESGPVHDLTIRHNLFIECGSPVIAITPEIDRFDQPVHRNILIEANRFIINSGEAVRLNAVDNVTITHNIFDIPAASDMTIQSLINDQNSSRLNISDNKIIKNE